MTHIAFSKYSGCGNDFIIIDNRAALFPFQDPSTIQSLCDRREGIGADGLILLESSLHADFRMRIFNCDGSEAEMCGNGIRCLMAFIHKLHRHLHRCTIETMERIIPLELIDNHVKAFVGAPTDLKCDLTTQIDNRIYQLHHLNTGVPHCVTFVADLEAIDLLKVGQQLRSHALFGSKGTNVNFASTQNGQVLYRTYERGVEGETPACGTGAVAVALATAISFGWTSPITVLTRSNQPLEIGFTRTVDQFADVSMTGPAIHVFDGHFTWTK